MIVGGLLTRCLTRGGLTWRGWITISGGGESCVRPWVGRCVSRACAWGVPVGVVGLARRSSGTRARSRSALGEVESAARGVRVSCERVTFYDTGGQTRVGIALSGIQKSPHLR